jgi:hypothetical protein
VADAATRSSDAKSFASVLSLGSAEKAEVANAAVKAKAMVVPAALFID